MPTRTETGTTAPDSIAAPDTIALEWTHPAQRRRPRSDALTWKPLEFLTLYRLTLAGLLAALFFLLPVAKNLGEDAPWLYGITSLTYLLFALLAGFLARARRPRFGVQVFIQVQVDIIALVLLMHAGGGLESGLGILLVLAVAAGALLMPGKLAYYFAAVATVAVLVEFSYSMLLKDTAILGSADYTRAGLLGLALFTTATIAHLLAARIRDIEALAARRGVDLANLARLNEHVVQRLQSGILVVDERERVHLINDTARVMLQADRARSGDVIQQFCPQLAEQLRAWRDNPNYGPPPFTPANTPVSLAARFTPLGEDRQSATLIFLEDTAALAQQAQQMKLAALGRLTASIAHEIRNPLGAISHAGQLLGESSHLDSGEQRLTDIIRNHCQRVNNIIENVLQLSRRGESAPKDIALEPWLRDFIDELVRSQNIPGDAIEILTEGPAFSVSFDPNHLHQVVWNLLHNAIQHGGGRIRVRLGDTEARQPCLEVLDEGPGIDADTEAHIFEPFFTTAATGTGLGLYLSRELCELNRARLSYSRRSDDAGATTGSRFRITFTRYQRQGP